MVHFIIFIITYMALLGFPGGSDGKKICLQCRRPGFDPWVGKIPWRRKRQPAPVSFPGEFHGRRSLAGCNPWGLEESDTTERLTHTHTHTHTHGFTSRVLLFYCHCRFSVGFFTAALGVPRLPLLLLLQ